MAVEAVDEELETVRGLSWGCGIDSVVTVDSIRL